MSGRKASVRMCAAALLAAGTWVSSASAGDAPEVVAAKKGCDARQWADCHKLGQWYRDGYPVNKDAKKAVGLFKKACDGGHLPACRALADMYADGNGVDESSAQAGALMQKACDGGDAESCFDLAYHASDYDLPTSKVPDVYEKGCNAGSTKACYNGGNAASHGGDRVKAAALWEKGCNAGDAASCYNGGTAVGNGEGVPRDGARAAAMLSKACDAPVPEDKDFKDLPATACFNLGVLYEHGEALPQDLKKAHVLFDRACKAKLSEACRAVENVKVFERNPLEAKSGTGGGINFYLLKECDNGSAVACRTLAEQYATGAEGMTKNPARSVELFKKANALNSALCDKGGKGAPMACMELSRAYEGGNGVAKSPARATEIAKKALTMSQTQCTQGDMEECVMVGFAYQFGNGVPKDLAKAAALFKKACDAGERSGCTNAESLAKSK